MGGLIILEEVIEEEGPVIEEEAAATGEAIAAEAQVLAQEAETAAKAIAAEAEALAQQAEAEGEAILNELEDALGDGEVDEVEEECSAEGGDEGGGDVPQKAKDAADWAENSDGGPRPGYKGGGSFSNDGRGGGEILPQTDANGNPISYLEWDVDPYTPGVNRGAERVVTGSDGSAYYTNNHYDTFTKFK